MDFVRLSARKKKADEAQNDAEYSSKSCAAIEFWNDDFSVRGAQGRARSRLAAVKQEIPGA